MTTTETTSMGSDWADTTGGARERARNLALGRIGFGVAMVLLPRVVGRSWIGGAASSGGVTTLVRAVGVRDVALGVATLDAIDEGRPLSRLLQLGVACDSVDATILLTGRDVPFAKRCSGFVAAAGAAALGASLVDRVD